MPLSPPLTLTQELGTLTKLTKLNMAGNPLQPPFSRLVEVLGELSLVEFCSSASDRLDITNCSFVELPAEVWGGTKVFGG